MDSYIKAYVRVHVHIDAGARVWCKGEQLKVHTSGDGTLKVVLPISKILFSFDDLKRMGARCDVQTLKTLAMAGADARWSDEQVARRENGLPKNVYVANARTIQLAIAAGKPAPPARFLARKRDRMTDVYATADEAVLAMHEERWRTKFSKGQFAKTGYVEKKR
jgi:hypothetical protein